MNRAAPLCALLVSLAPGCASVPQPARQRVGVHAISGTANAQSRGAHHQQSGGGFDWDFNNGEGLIAGARLTVVIGADTAIEPDLRENYGLYGLSVGGGRVGRLTSLEGGLSTINSDASTLGPWLRLTVGAMQVVRVGVTLGPEAPLFLQNFAELHARLLLHTYGLPLELKLGYAAANRTLFIARPDRGDPFADDDQFVPSDAADGERAGAVLCGEIVWRGPHLGLLGKFAMGDVDVAQLGVFYDFE